LKGLIGKKIGMTQIFSEDGNRIPVTVVDVSENIVIQKKTTEGADGYNAIKVGFTPSDRQEKNGMIRFRGSNKPETGVFQKAGIDTPYRYVREFRVNPTELDEFEVGVIIDPAAQFNSGDVIDVTGISKGRGFTGVIKRHGFAMARATHGTHEHFRHGGSIGQSAWPAKVWKGKKMPGQHGNKKVTVQNLKIVELIPDEGLLLVKGSIPGPNGSIITVRKSAKKLN
jgi:large subunit ribosomal protein L3